MADDVHSSDRTLATKPQPWLDAERTPRMSTTPSRAPLEAVQPNVARVATPSKLATKPQPCDALKAATLAINEAAAAAAAAAALATSLAAAVALPAVPGYDVVDKLGRGGFGAVYLAYAPDGREVAVKVVLHGGRGAGESRYAKFDPEEVEHEAAMHRRLAATQHPATVPLCELIAESERSILVFHRVAGCELGRHLSKQPHGRLAEAEARDAARQLLSALFCFHATAGVAHMDIVSARPLPYDRDPPTPAR